MSGRGEDEEKPDAIEVWGVRIGRFLGAVALLGLALYLVLTYGPR
ncbi:MAG TPA: hypothetical protein PKA74_14265 [Bauldia sp.]|nr:hypothetical protein [Bauldia sp.]